jgi:hypothetical protein
VSSLSHEEREFPKVRAHQIFIGRLLKEERADDTKGLVSDDQKEISGKASVSKFV